MGKESKVMLDEKNYNKEEVLKAANTRKILLFCLKIITSICSLIFLTQIVQIILFVIRFEILSDVSTNSFSYKLTIMCVWGIVTFILAGLYESILYIDNKKLNTNILKMIRMLLSEFYNNKNKMNYLTLALLFTGAIYVTSSLYHNLINHRLIIGGIYIFAGILVFFLNKKINRE